MFVTLSMKATVNQPFLGDRVKWDLILGQVCMTSFINDS